jgi:uncharacterized membrane protein
MQSWTILIAAHAAGATLAVLLGGWNLWLSRKGDLLHRRVGRLWFVTMYWVAFSSFGIKRLTPGHFSWIHGLSAWTLISLTVALWAAFTHRIDLHKNFVAGSYFGLLGAGIAAVAFPQRLVPQTAMHAPLHLLVALAGLTALAWLLVRWCAGAGRRSAEVSFPAESGIPYGRDPVRPGRSA